MINIDKHAVQAVADLKAGYTLGHADVAILNELARIALASLEVEPVAYMYKDNLHADARFSLHTRFGNWSQEDINEYEITEIPLYTAPPAPVSVPECFTNAVSALESLYRNGKKQNWNERYTTDMAYASGVLIACRAAMLQGADGTLTNEGTIPVTQFKPVADLYGLTSPTGSETSFTFDAVEARDFIDGGWSCQEYVELGRFQEAITNHTEDKLAMVNHSGDSNNMVEPVTTANELRDAIEIIRNSGIEIDAEKIFAERDALNSPVIPDGWKLVPIELTGDMTNAMSEAILDDLHNVDVWRSVLAAAPQQEAK
ncbi:TPA: hypothetical protein LTW87_003001 [Enterobacter hormaechei]|nr:hypothetical protein [Enterobacter hormaechei]HBL9022762.1 hypothetical protein [Enterobacter hormaechei]HBL9046763.1 hypothetical protein [Enterobacter hormaechei]HBL9056529.1 hypothetical protein [Enterobacter hormaechei]HBL9069847.1 hypothetical protein [Enterobacter hormaechei]